MLSRLANFNYMYIKCNYRKYTGRLEPDSRMNQHRNCVSDDRLTVVNMVNQYYNNYSGSLFSVFGIINTSMFIQWVNCNNYVILYKQYCVYTWSTVTVHTLIQTRSRGAMPHIHIMCTWGAQFRIKFLIKYIVLSNCFLLLKARALGVLNALNVRTEFNNDCH